MFASVGSQLTGVNAGTMMELSGSGEVPVGVALSANLTRKTAGGNVAISFELRGAGSQLGMVALAYPVR
jgi:hypothetical protein